MRIKNRSAAIFLSLALMAALCSNISASDSAGPNGVDSNTDNAIQTEQTAPSAGNATNSMVSSAPSEILSATPSPSAPPTQYNYKLTFESSNELGTGYGYCGGSASPKPPAPTKTFVSDGKYGKAMEITYKGFYVANPADRWGGVYYSPMNSMITTKAGTDPVPLVNYMRYVKQVAFWVKAPYSSYVGSDTRQFDLRFQTNYGTYGYTVYVKNTGDWQYIKIPFSSFRDNSKGSITNNFDNITNYQALLIAIPYGQKYFGREPAPPRNPNDPASKADTWINPWVEPLDIDEMVFDCSTADNPMTTLPSVGEEGYFSDANLSAITVNGIPIPDFEEVKNDSLIDIKLPNNYTAKDITSDVVKGVPACPPVEGSTSPPYAQIQSGATWKLIPPAAFPGTGSIVVTAGDGITQKIYNLNFIKRHPLQIQQVSGISPTGPLTQGQKNIVITVNNEGDISHGASVIAIVSEKATGKVKSVGFAYNDSILAGQTSDFNLSVTVPDNPQNYSLAFYIWDGIKTANSIADPIIIG